MPSQITSCQSLNGLHDQYNFICWPFVKQMPQWSVCYNYDLTILYNYHIQSIMWTIDNESLEEMW